MGHRVVHECICRGCKAGDTQMQAQHSQLNLLMSRLNEQQRRWLAGVEANRLGYGGSEQVHKITGLDINTIRRGRVELEKGLAGRPVEGIRVGGGGRKRLEKK